MDRKVSYLDALGLGVTALVIAAAVIRTVTAPEIVSGSGLDPSSARDVYADVAGAEPKMRADAARKFPGDRWSQDDDFHNTERRRMRSIAGRLGVRLADVMRAVDDGMRERWPLPPGVSPPRPTAAPCRPRLSY